MKNNISSIAKRYGIVIDEDCSSGGIEAGLSKHAMLKIKKTFTEAVEELVSMEGNLNIIGEVFDSSTQMLGEMSDKGVNDASLKFIDDAFDDFKKITILLHELKNKLT